ncbi:uncharacterized mitochondrial protein AtMg00810-like [Solanum lycopersicum]|uniref:uncharacterized mitochondrial protein AtMg00810-like n=1 Tax=Solanum lycopersicum TaxID=4081 RepID=UPI0008FEBE1D|nr:uncharacterized protein LOC109120453 [Solanum lycopersicum]
MVTVRTIVSLAAARHWHIHQMDVFNAFLQGDLDDEIYMQLPQGFVGQGEKSEGGTILMLVYVDDMLITGSSLKLIEDTKKALQQVFKMKDLGELKYFLGIEFTRSPAGILMHQRKYTLELIVEVGLTAAKPAGTPIDINVKLTSILYDEHVNKEHEESDDPLIDQTAYQKIIGKLLYLNTTRPDISFSTQTLSQFLQQPKRSHLDVGLRVIRYLNKQLGQGLLLASDSDGQVTAFCDADWASCPLTRKSVTGYMVKIGQSLISWKAKKQTTVSRSSDEAEYRSLATTISELMWLLGLLKEIGTKIQVPFQVYSDSKAAIHIAGNPVYHERIKHIEIDCHFIREKLQKGLIKVEYIHTKEQPVDVLTKGLSRLQHEHLLSKLGVLNIFAPPSLKGSVVI